jgi:hypothetical protein
MQEDVGSRLRGVSLHNQTAAHKTFREDARDNGDEIKRPGDPRDSPRRTSQNLCHVNDSRQHGGRLIFRFAAPGSSNTGGQRFAQRIIAFARMGPSL